MIKCVLVFVDRERGESEGFAAAQTEPCQLVRLERSSNVLYTYERAFKKFQVVTKVSKCIGNGISLLKLGRTNGFPSVLSRGVYSTR